MTQVEPKTYLEQAELIYSAQAVQLAIDNIASDLNHDYQHEFPIVLSVMTGGAVFTGQLLPKLSFALELDYVQATRYHGQTKAKQLDWVVKPKTNIAGRKVLILDDILDEGVTLKAIVDECLKLGASQVNTAVLTRKDLPIASAIQADYVGLVVPNRYVFGCGMDVNNCWRNLPAIYALNHA